MVGLGQRYMVRILVSVQSLTTIKIPASITDSIDQLVFTEPARSENGLLQREQKNGDKPEQDYNQGT